MKTSTLLTSLLLSIVFYCNTALAIDPTYTVAYGAPGVPGRVYDSINDTTTFSYTVIGQGADPDDYISRRLKGFKVEVEICEPELELDSYAPDLEENAQPWFFAGSNPDILAPADDPTDLDFLGVLWKGWHGNGELPVLLNPDEQRSFSITFVGNIEVGPITTATALVSNATGEFETTVRKLPGASCEKACENRQVFDFNTLTAGSILTDQYQSMGLTVTAANGSASQLDNAVVFNTESPNVNETDLGTPNIFYGGLGQPTLNAADGTGVGNFLSQKNALVIPNCDPSTESVNPADMSSCGAGPGTITFSFSSPAKVISASFIDIEESGTKILGRNGSQTIINEVVPALGNNSLQTVVLSHIDQSVTELSVDMSQPAAIDNLTVCLDPAPNPTPSPTTPPKCDERTIEPNQLVIDGNARQQQNAIKKLANRLKRNAKGKKQRQFARQARQEAEKLYVNAWTITWNMESLYTECENINDSCIVSSDYEISTAEFLATSTSFVNLAEQVNNKLRRARGGQLRQRDIAIQRKVQNLDVANQKETDLIPNTTTTCPAEF